MSVVLEGEVIDAPDTFRRRERNAERTSRNEIAVLPPDVQTKVSALQTLNGAGQAAAVTAMLSHARTGLLAAIAAQDLPQIVEFKRKAAAIQEIAKQVRLGKDIELDAAEFVRRAERGLGVAIREGQENGEVRTKGQSNTFGNAHTTSQPLPTKSRPAPADFATPSELSGANRSGEGIYAMTDGVSDEQFEESITEAKSEGNLSRANVARKAKAKAHKKEAIDENDPLIDAEVEPKPAASKKPARDPIDQAHSDADVINAITAVLKPIFTEKNMQDVAPKAKARLVRLLEDAIKTIKKGM